MNIGNIGTLIVIAVICGAIAAVIGQKKNFNVNQSFLWGALLGVIGIFIVAVRRPNPPKPPRGMRAVRCPRCNAMQNIPDAQATFECWQCKLVSKRQTWRGSGDQTTPSTPANG
jgi:hypothetical protein